MGLPTGHLHFGIVIATGNHAGPLARRWRSIQHVALCHGVWIVPNVERSAFPLAAVVLALDRQVTDRDLAEWLARHESPGVSRA